MALNPPKKGAAADRGIRSRPAPNQKRRTLNERVRKRDSQAPPCGTNGPKTRDHATVTRGLCRRGWRGTAWPVPCLSRDAVVLIERVCGGQSRVRGGPVPRARGGGGAGA